jgi:hypothetical protein
MKDSVLSGKARPSIGRGLKLGAAIAVVVSGLGHLPSMHEAQSSTLSTAKRGRGEEGSGGGGGRENDSRENDQSDPERPR